MSLRSRRDIIDRTSLPDETGRRSNLPSDSTGAAVVDLLDKTALLESWIAVTTETFEHFRGTPKGSLMTMYYVEQRHTICKQLFVSGQTFYDWRQDILIYAAFQAVRRGLMRI